MRPSPSALASVLLVLPLVLSGQDKAPPPASSGEQVMCVVCGDYTFDRKDGTPATYEGEKIWLCNLKELDLIKQSPDKYVWATDPVSGARVNKVHTRFTIDRRVQVRKGDGKAEVWPRRFFFESAKTRDEFLKRPERYVKEPYAV